MVSNVLVVKIGTNVLSNEDGTLDYNTIDNIVSQIVYLKNIKNFNVLVVSSGAVGAGTSIYGNLEDIDETVAKQVLSSLGQVKLMNTYAELFEKSGLLCAQVLATKEDFRDEEHYSNMHNCISALLNKRIVPIINENDVVAIRELMFTDNDELAGLIASMVSADRLFLLTSVDGVYDGPPLNKGSKIIKEIKISEKNITDYAYSVKSTFGRGGMKTKLNVAHKAAINGTKVHIINGKKTDVIIQIINGEKLGTIINK